MTSRETMPLGEGGSEPPNRQGQRPAPATQQMRRWFGYAVGDRGRKGGPKAARCRGIIDASP